MSYFAESYERIMVPSLFAPWATYLVQRANPQPGEYVLDGRAVQVLLPARLLHLLDRKE